MAAIFISAGEASGDHYGAELIAHMRARSASDPLTFFGLCGPAMLAEGCEPVVRAEDVAHMGITEVLRHAPYIYRQFQKLRRSLADRKPALAVLIDFPDVNFRLAKRCHKLGIPVLWLVSPQLWAWKKRRIRWVQHWVTKMLVIFPFEEQFYRERGVAAEFIGHPLADLPLPTVSREQFAKEYGLDSSKPWIALLPGSRGREFALNFDVLVDTTKLLGNTFQFVVPIAATLDWQQYSQRVASAGLVPVRDARAAMFHARASVVASGTATVQAALMGNPFVIVYKMSPLSYRLARAFVSVPFAGMPNLIAGREIVPELLQEKFTAANVVRHLQTLVEDGQARAQQQQDLRQLKLALTPTTQPATGALPNGGTKAENGRSSGAIARAADAALALLHSSP